MTPTANPPRLVEANDDVGTLLRASLPEYAAGLVASDVGRAPARARAAASKGQRVFWPIVLAGAACAAALALFLPAEPSPSGIAGPARSTSAGAPIIVPLTAVGPAQAPVDESAKHRPTHTAALRARPRPLEAGQEVALTDGSRVRLAPGGVASVSAPERDRTVVALSRGIVGLVVAKRRPGETFEVHAGPYTFRVVGTSFTVDLRGGKAFLAVAEGTVVVSAGDRELGRVSAGGAWNGEVDVEVKAQQVDVQAQVAVPEPSPIPPAVAAVAAPPAPETEVHPPVRALRQPGAAEPAPLPAEPPRARLPTSTECLGQARAGATKSAARCLEEVAASHGLEAEIALVELARLRRDALDDAKGALAALADYRARFPRGALYEEALGASVDLLVRTGDGRAALADSDRLLRRVSNEQRRAELHLLRGNILRVLERDCWSADAEYAAASKAHTDRVVDDAAFWRAVCLDTVGARDAATRAFKLYLDRPRPQHAAEAKTHLETLRR